MPNEIARSLLDRARAFHATGNDLRARADLVEARTVAVSIADQRIRTNIDVDLAIAATETTPAADSAAVLRSFDGAIKLVVRTNKQTVLPRLWIERGRAAADAQLNDEAERSLREAIDVIEKQRRSVANRDLQIDFAEEWYHAFDMMVDLLVRDGRTDEALEYTERSRARVLAQELISPDGLSHATNVHEIAQVVPADAVVIVYATLSKSTASWLVRRDSIVFVNLPITRGAMQQLVENTNAAIASHSDVAACDALAKLEESIFAPLAPRLRPRERIIFAPDAVLQSVPFAALYNKATRQWLIETRAVGITPSMHLIAATLTRDHALTWRGRDRVLILGDPAFDVTRFPNLQRLSGAAREARRIAALYPVAKILLGSEATRAALLRRARDFPIIHIAAHALVNVHHPSRSALVLAPDEAAGDAGVLYAFDIDGRTFSSTRLVVLGACSTAGSKNTHYEGPLGLARSFLAAGVPDVVATLWDIDDDASMSLLLTFHRRLRVGEDALTALRDAQCSLIHSPNTEYRRVQAWAGLQLVGGFLQ